MKSLIATALFLLSDAASVEETSLMQGLVARRGQMSPESTSRKDATAKLMETATKMMKNGATPDVITFIETTITEVNRDVLGVIVEEHHRDQQLINDLLARFDSAIAAMEACAASIQQQHIDRESTSHAHQLCRSDESHDCARSRKCEEELEELWSIVKIEEGEMRRIHWAIHGEWCEGPAPPHPGLGDPFQWTLEESWEGPETSQSTDPYPTIDLTPVVIEFRRFSVEYFGHYILQKPRVELAWTNYNLKLIECAALEETWTLKVDDCDELQTTLHAQACEHASSNRQCASNFGHEYHMTMVAYQNAVTTIRQLEQDRKREWETLHIVTCLLETVYTHVIHSINSGEPCPTTESHPDQTVAEINTCHIIEESMTANLTIDYGTPPTPPTLPPVVEPPCTAQYIWDETGAFNFEIQSSHSQTIADEGLESYFTVLSAYGWAGCAAPKACTPCESTDLVVDPAYTENEVCKAHHSHLHPGQMDWDTFKCLSGDECIKASGRCNGASNCDDGSDELGCDTHWGVPAVLGAQECQDPFVSDVQFRCADNTCTHVAGRCNGVNNCADGSDEQGCATTTTGLTLEAMTGFTATIETPAVNSAVFYDRTYTFDSLGSFTGHSFIKMSNEDKHIRNSHVQMKLRLPQPLTVYVAKLDDTELSWLQSEGYVLTHLEGITYHGVRQTRHTDWSGELHEDHYGPGAVWQKTFPAGAIELRGNNGGDGSYVMFVANPANPPTPPILPGADEYIGCFVDDAARDLGEMVGVWTNSATNTFDLCRAACGSHQFMSLQWGGECFCANSYSNADQYVQVGDSECNVVREPCSPNSHNCGGTWRQAIYRINTAWELIAHQQDSSWFPSSAKTTYNVNEGDSSASSFMNVGTLSPSDYSVNGKYFMRLVYGDVTEQHTPGNDGPALNGGSQEFEWSQTSWITSDTVTGYEPISSADLAGSPTAGCVFHGLARSSTGSTVFDGSPDHGNWFHSVGSTTQWGIGIPAFKGGNAQTMSLYISRADPTPWCQNGILSSGGACCASQCGTCGGSGCSSRPGGADQCCQQHITGIFQDGRAPTGDQGRVCENAADVVCAVP